MTRRIQQLLSVPIKPAIMLAVAVRLGRALITSPTNGRGTGGKILSQCARVSRRSPRRDWHAFSASCIYDRHPIFGATSMRKEIAVNSEESVKCIADTNLQVSRLSACDVVHTMRNGAKE
jgi:hypothetical protein